MQQSHTHTLGACLRLRVGASASTFACSRSLPPTVVCAVSWPRYGFGWENQLLETAFLAAFAVPLVSLQPFAPACPPPAVIPWLYKWLAFRIMFGASLWAVTRRYQASGAKESIRNGIIRCVLLP